MKLNVVEGLAKAMAPAIRNFVGKSTAPLIERIAALESQVRALQGKRPEQ